MHTVIMTALTAQVVRSADRVGLYKGQIASYVFTN